MSAVQKRQQWKLIGLLNWTADYLDQKGFENSRLEAERLLAHSLHIQRIDLYVNFERPLIPDELAQFKSLLKRRLDHEPLQYIIGETEFFSLPIKVAPGVLIPRPETEVLVENALQIIKENFSQGKEINVLDVGTGSGNIAIAIAKNAVYARLTAVDISADALKIARQNAELNNVADKINFLQHDALGDWPLHFTNYFDLILSNPPYISDAEFENLPQEIREFEPRQALLGGKDGVDFYNNFCQILLKLLCTEGNALFEIGETMRDVLLKNFLNCGFSNMEMIQDLSGKNRVLKMQKGGGNE
ncbi:MAG: peptide chain release factor N(5)-glutamine methyltransferase [Actinobacteria bacterium]|nr:peptide chain release factor N(5)-glutamine methyltransferase [Actinomycetota bacterium]